MEGASIELITGTLADFMTDIERSDKTSLSSSKVFHLYIPNSLRICGFGSRVMPRLASMLPLGGVAVFGNTSGVIYSCQAWSNLQERAQLRVAGRGVSP